MNSNLKRVNRSHPCQICSKPDWCSYSSDGQIAICMRVEHGAVKQTKNGGFLHRLTVASSIQGQRVFSMPVSPVRDFSRFAKQCQQAVDTHALFHFAVQLGLTVKSLIRLGIGWSDSHRAWSFPMTDINGKVQGIRLRRDDGRKFAVKGSKEGLFLPGVRHGLQCHWGRWYNWLGRSLGYLS